MMFADKAGSKRIANGAASAKRAATTIRAVLGGNEAFMKTASDVRNFAAVLTEAETDTLRAAVAILDSLHSRRSKQAKAAAAEERAFLVREKAARLEAVKIFDSWRLDVAAWLPFVIAVRGRWWVDRDVQDGRLAGEWGYECHVARRSFLDQIAWEVASGRGKVLELMQVHREKLAADRECADIKGLAQQITTALVARQLEQANREGQA